MDPRESYLGKRSFSVLEGSIQHRPEEDDIPVTKKLRTKLVDIFNRASVSMTPLEDYIKVYLRMKPFTHEENSSQKCFVVAAEENTLVATAPEQSHAYRNMKRGLGNSSHKFTFSRIFNENTSQGDFFNSTMLGMTKDFISGQNSLVFTYGVTSSGKTYTIQGQPQNAGILPRCLDVIFNSISGKQIPSLTSLKPRMFTDVVRLSPTEVVLERKIKEKTLKMSIDDDTTVMTLLGDEMESALSDTATASSSGCGDEMLTTVQSRDREKLKVDVEDQGQIRFGVWVSFSEIYNEQIFDLLDPIPRKKSAKRPALKISDDRNGNPYIKGLKEIHVESADEAYRLLTIGQRNLQTACTRLNHCSSRSHCIFNIKIIRVVDKDDPNIARVSMLSLCDLAGSERYSKTQSTGDRLKEAGNINASLMTLGRCIETLRHNQQHRDQQRLVPFRDSKLTRLLQNYFNGSGRAAMIVNVSQCASMFDDTLHVFKFSAIAKQVKYIEKPPEPPKKQKEKKVIPPAQRPSIEWEVPAPSENGTLKDAQNQPLPSGDDDDDDDDIVGDDDDDLQEYGDESHDDSSDSFRDMKEMRIYIKTLELRIERLVELLQEGMDAARNIESSVRQEVSQAMMQQIVNIEETYSALVKETSEDVQEIADERMRGIMAVYEQRLERIQRKVDEDDEWVSSLLYYQQTAKVEERDATIVSLRAQIEELSSQNADLKNKFANDSVDFGNSVLIETLTHKLQEANDKCKIKDGKIEELESLVSEAGDVYNGHIKEISKLTEQNEKMKNQISSVKELESQLKEITTTYDALKVSLKNKETEWKQTEEKFNRRIESKDDTISSLQDECKELHDEIERLQDRMSQMDENSKYRNELETSALSEQKSTAGDSDLTKDADKLSESVTEQGRYSSNETERDSKTQRKMEGSSVKESLQEEVASDPVIELKHLKEEAAIKDKQVESLKLASEELDQQIQFLQGRIDGLLTEMNIANGKSVVDTEVMQKTLEQVQEKLTYTTQCALTAEEKLASSHHAEEQIRNELETLQKAHVEVTKKAQALEKQMEDMSKTEAMPELEEAITQGMGKLNKETTPLVARIDGAAHLNTETMNQSDDNEIVFSTKVAESLKQETDKLREENCALQTANLALTERCHVLEGQLNVKDISKENIDEDNKDGEIGEIVRQIEQKATPFKSNMSDINVLNQSHETEVVLKTPSTGVSKTSVTTSMKLRDAELANAALRSKLKREEEDFFKREQALIHGYTAEIENLKYELAKIKSKVDVPSKTLTRGKRKATAIDTSTSSVVSDSVGEISIIGDSKMINIQEESVVTEQHSVAILSNELLSVQQELLSVGAAYRKLVTAQRRKTGSFIQNVILGSAPHVPSALGAFRAEENFGDSVLQFELDEYAVKMDEMRIKISQQEDEIKISKSTFDNVKAEKSEIENKLKEILQRQEAESFILKRELEKGAVRNVTEEKLQQTVAANCQLQSKVKESEEMITQLKETLSGAITARNEAEQRLTDVTEQLILRKEQHNEVVMDLNKMQEAVETANNERDTLKQTITNLTETHNLHGRHTEEFEQQLEKLKDLLKQTECELKSCKEDLIKQENLLQESNTKLSDTTAEKVRLEESVQRKCEELACLEQKYGDAKENLGKTASIKNDFESKLKYASEKLAGTEDTITKLQEEYDSRINSMKQEFSGEGKANLETVSKLERCIDDLKAQLEKKSEQFEKLECLKQEEAAEVSQKLLMLEREKKLAERKAADAKEREIEWQQKSQGLNNLTQLEHQMRQDLRTAAENMRKHSMLTIELRDELATKNKELDELKEELDNVKTSMKKTQDLKVKELELSIASEEKHLQEVLKSNQEYQDIIDSLKSGIKECGETLEQQEFVISTQDDEMRTLRAELDVQKREAERLNIIIEKKDLTVDKLNERISKLEVDITSFQQSERAAMSVEQNCHDQLAKSRCENRELEERIHTLERENKILEDSVGSSEKQIKKERKVLEDLEERIHTLERENKILEDSVGSSEKQIKKERKVFEDLEEKMRKAETQKNDLEREIEQMKGQQRNLEEQIQKDNKQRDGELEKLHLMEAELKNFKREADEGSIEGNKHRDHLQKENSSLKEELHKLKQDILCNQDKVDKINETLKQATENQTSLEKELRKKDSINKRNREEMENWKQERDACVNKLEQHINKGRQENRLLGQENWKQERDACVNKLEQHINKGRQENRLLGQENEQLKKDNADLAKNVGNVTSMKDSVIADLRKINNTLSIQLARVQGMSPPPKMATPDNSVLHRNEFIEDLDTTGHLEIDATPPIAAKKCRKRQGSSRQNLSSHSATSSNDSETWATPVHKSLKPIEEQNENSPKSTLHGRVAELANDVICSISPLTRSARRQEKDNKRKQLSGVQVPFDLASYVAASETNNENANPSCTRRSSRLKTKTKSTLH